MATPGPSQVPFSKSACFWSQTTWLE